MIKDNFEIKKDCHIIKNNLFDFIPKIELDFNENIEMNEELFKLLKFELKKFQKMIISIIEMNKGSFHILISLLFIFKKKNISTINEGLKNITGMIKNFCREHW